MTPAMLRRCLIAAIPATVAAMLVLAPLAVVPLTACSGSTDVASPCDRVLVQASSSGVGASIRDCSAGSTSLTNIAYNSDNSVRSFDFDVRCTAPSERHTGHVDITYEAAVVTGYSKTVDGQVCS
jgi:hypothetical protein